MRFQAVNKQVLFKSSHPEGPNSEVAITGHPDWARRITDALNATDKWPVGRTTLWIADDGSYGSGEVVVIDTTNWTPEQHEAVQEASDFDRLDVARAQEGN